MYQRTYIAKVLKGFYMDKSCPLCTLLIVRSLNVNKYPFRPWEKNEELLDPEVPYLSAIKALLYLASHTRLDISFAINLLARYSSSPTQRHWNGKQVFRYLKGTLDMSLFFPFMSKLNLIGYADAGYLSKYLKQVTCLHVEEQPFHGDLWKKLW